MAKALLVVGRNNQAVTLGNFATFGSAPSSANYDVESEAAKPARIAGTISDLKARVNNQGTARHIKVRKNNADTVLDVAPTDSTAGNFQDLGTVSYGTTDTYDIQFTGTAPAFTLFWARAIWEAASGHSTFIASASSLLTDGIQPIYMAFGSGSTSAAELLVQNRLKGAGTISKCAALVAVASTAIMTIRLRKNNADANTNISVPANTTGVFEDLSSTDSFVENDALSWKVSGHTGSPAVQIVSLVEYTSPQNDLFTLPIGNFTANASPQFMAIGGSSGATLTETDVELDHGFSVNASKLRVNNMTNTVTSTVTLTLRKNNVDTASFATIPPGTTGEYEAISSALVLYAPTDKIAVKFTGGSSGSLSFSSVGVTEFPVAPQTLTQNARHDNASVIYAPSVALETVRIVDSYSGTGAGSSFVINFTTPLQPFDTVYVFGGHSTVIGQPAITAPTPGYTELAIKNMGAGWSYGFGAWRKRMGSTPDTSVTVGTNGITGSQAYIVYIVRGAHTASEDVAATLNFASNSANIDPPAVSPISGGVLVLATAGMGVTDTSVTAPTGYSDVKAAGGGSPQYSAIGAGKSAVPAGLEDPGPFGSVIGSASYVGITVAVRPAPSNNQTLSPDFFDDSLTDTFFTPVLTPGPVTIAQATRFDDLPDTFFTPALKGVTTLVQAARYDDPDDVKTPVVTRGAVTLTQTVRYDNLPDTFFTPLVGTGDLILAVDFFDDSLTDQFFPPLAFPGARTLIQTTRYDDPDTIESPIVSSGAPGLFPSFFDDSLTDQFFTPTISQQAIGLQVGPFVNENQFFQHSAVYPQTLVQAQRFNNASVFNFHSIFTPFVPPEYNFPIGRSLWSDYGLRHSRTFKSKYIIGRR